MAARSPLVILLSLLIVATVAGMFTALFWTLWRFVTGRPLLPPWPDPPRVVPWGGGAILLVVVAWVASNLAVSSAYLLVRSHYRIRLAALPAVAPPPRLTKVLPGPSADPASPAPRLSFKEQMLLVSLINGVLLLFLPSVIPFISGAGRRDLGLRSNDLGRDLKLGVMAFLGITPVVMSINALAQLILKPHKHPLEKMLRDEMSPGLVALAYLSAVVLAPAVEELVFRALLQGWLRRLTLARPKPRLETHSLEDLSLAEPEWGGSPVPTLATRFRWFPRLPRPWPVRPVGSLNPFDAPPSLTVEPGTTTNVRDQKVYVRALPIVLTSLIFATVHFEQMPAPLAIFPLSLVLGLLYERTESLVPSFVLHALFNGFNTTMLVVAITVAPELKP